LSNQKIEAMNTVKNLRSGIVNVINSTDLASAKAEAIRQATYEGGSLELYFGGRYYYADLQAYPDHTFAWVWAY